VAARAAGARGHRRAAGGLDRRGGGVGKTRLADQLASTASEQGVRVLRGGCVPLGEEGVPFVPISEALRGLARDLPRPGRLPRRLPAVRPGRAGLHVPRDELHRLHPLRGLLAELTCNRRVQRLELRRFTRSELAEQLTALLGADPPARLVDDVHARSEGNPFLAEELVLGGAGDATGPGALPASLQEVLAAVTGMEEAELLDSLREAVDHHVLLPEPDGDG
jgi:AAA ATPase domain